MQPSEAVAQAVALIAPIAAGGANIAQGLAVKVLGDLMVERLRRDGHASAWEEFRRNPQNNSLVRHLLQQALSQDADFRDRFAKALQEASHENPRNSGQQTINVADSGEAQIGDRGDTITDSRVATRGSTYHEEIHNAGDRVTHKKSNATAFVVLAVVALVIIGLGILIASSNLKGSHDGGLTASSTCQQFLNTDEQTEQQALVDIAMSKGIGGFGSPLALPEIRYECSSEPTMTMGAIVERDKGQY